MRKKYNSYLLKKDDNEEKKGSNYLVKAATGFFLILLVKWLWPSLIPFTMFELWNSKGGFIEWLIAGKLIFIWAFIVHIVLFIAKKDDICSDLESETPGDILKKGFLISLWAGVVEEISFRWLIFLSSMVGLFIGNWFLGGFIGKDWGIIQWLYVTIFGSIADFFTAGHLHDYLFHPTYWVIGASIITTNTLFRDGHLYQGWFGWINSWFMGMFFFYIMFKYGLPAAIVLHFAYDMLIFIMVAIFAGTVKKRYRRKSFWNI